MEKMRNKEIIDRIKKSIEHIDMNTVPEYNQIDWDNDTMNVIVAKAEAILKANG